MTATEMIDIDDAQDDADLGVPAPDESPQPAPVPRSPAAVSVRWVLAAICLLASWCVAYGLGLSSLQEGRDQTELYASFREQLADPQSQPSGAIAPGTPVILLQSGRGGLDDLVVVEGTSSGDLESGPGHRRDTPLPGQEGVSVLLGRGATFGAPFRSISMLKPGDLITATTAQGEFRYRVDRVRHAGDPLPAPPAAGTSRLTLVTSRATGWRSGWAPSGTVLVDATLQGSTVATPAGRPGSIPAPEAVMRGDRGALMTLVLWLQALVLVSLSLVWSRVRWGGWQTWLVGGPVLAAALWGASAAAAQLLPNLL